MKSSTSLWLVMHNDTPVRCFSSRIVAIDAVIRAIALRSNCLPSACVLLRDLLVSRGEIFAGLGLGTWSVVSVPVEM